MTWQDTAIAMLRVIINDMEDTPTYSDDRLTQILVTSAYLIVQDIDFDTTYTVNVVSETITPDPNTDIIFMNFLVIKAACQTDFSTYRTKALMDGVSAKAGPVSLSVAGHLKGFKDLLTMGPCDTYEAMKKDYVFGTGQMCKAILSPFVSSRFDPESLGVTYNDNREGYYT